MKKKKNKKPHIINEKNIKFTKGKIGVKLTHKGKKYFGKNKIDALKKLRDELEEE